MARAATAEELAYLRSENQRTRLFLAVLKPTTVFAAVINQTFTSKDMVAEVTYDTVTVGAYTDVKPDMTMYIGTTAGAYDVGMVRIRKVADASKIYFGETSEINWADNLYLTVVDDYSIWQRHLKISGETILMDYDVAYSNQHTVTDPVPVMGQHAVAWLTGATVEVDFDATDSWTLEGTITAYSWSAPGAAEVEGAVEAQFTATYDAAGIYLVSCTVTTSLGASFTGYRYVFIYSDASMPTTQFAIQPVKGEISGGGWSLELTLYDEALMSEIRDQALVILFAKDGYANAEISLGPVSGRENIVFIGWVAGESIKSNVEAVNTVTFKAYTADWWLSKLDCFPVGFEDTDFADNGGGAPDRWTEFEGLTVNKAYWHILRWRSTISRVTDCYPCTDTKEMASLESATGDLWGQTSEIATNSVIARACCDRYNRLFLELDAQLIPIADRDVIPVVMEVTNNDLREEVEIERRQIWQTSMVELSGTVYSSGSSSAIGARSPGSVFAHFGSVETITNLALESQAQALELAGLIAGMKNNEFGETPLKFACNFRLADITPRQYLTYSIAEGDTERGFVWTDKRLIPRTITFNYEVKSGVMLTDILCEPESPQLISTVMTFPGSDDGEGGTDTPIQPPTNPPQPPPPIEPPTPTLPGDAMVALELIVKISSNFFGADESVTWTTVATGTET